MIDQKWTITNLAFVKKKNFLKKKKLCGGVIMGSSEIHSSSQIPLKAAWEPGSSAVYGDIKKVDVGYIWSIRDS